MESLQFPIEHFPIVIEMSRIWIEHSKEFRTKFKILSFENIFFNE